MEIVAHEAWFTDERPPFDVDFLLEPLTLFSVAVAIALVMAWRYVAGRLPQPELPFLAPLGRLAPWVPRLLAIHAGVSLIAQAYGRTFLAPSLELANGTVGTLLAITEGVIGVWLVSGWRIKPAAMMLVVAGPVGMLFYNVVPILERVDLLAIAVFLVFLPPSADNDGAVDADPSQVRMPLFALRLMSGTSLIVLALTEKLIRPDLALVLLDDYPFLNIARLIGVDLPDLEFVRFAGTIELLFGFLVISGALPQITVLVAGIPFNATLFFFGASELVGHLPLYGVMLALLIYGSSERYAPVAPWVPTFSGDRQLLSR